MAQRCGTCYLEIEPGDKFCRRCNTAIEPATSIWHILLMCIAFCFVAGALMLLTAEIKSRCRYKQLTMCAKSGRGCGLIQNGQ